MPDQSNLRHRAPGRRTARTAAFGLGAAALAAPLALLGVNASVAAPDTGHGSNEASEGSGDASTPGNAAAAYHRGHPDHEHGFEPGGVDGEALRQRMIQDGTEGPDAGPGVSSDALRFTEEESAGTTGDNNRVSGAERVPRPRARHDRALRIDGNLSTETIEPRRIAPNQEDDGSIPLARDLKLGGDRRGVTTSGRIGDGPHGSRGGKTGDYDFYRVQASAGDTLTVDLAPDGELTGNVLLYDAEGNLLIGAQDMTGDGDSHLSHPIEQDGHYYLAVGNHFPQDPFDPGSGPAVITEGPYQLDVTLHTDRMSDTDVYAIGLREGDVLGATVSGSAGRIAIHESNGDLVQASAADSGVVYPKDSPLPRGGNATANHVVQRTGLYFLTISDGSGDYSVTTASHPAPSTTGEGGQQTVLLDFSGPTFDNRVFGGSVVEPGVRDISPMRDFLPRWGLDESDEKAVIEATTERVEQILREDIGGSKVRVVNSLENPDLFGKPGVSRVLVGGTVEESGLLPAFGMSESVDPGNFNREDTAIVMPERMSGDDQPMSLNHFLTEDSDRIQAVAQALGNTAGHEIGHFLGNYHTDDHAEHTSVMNTGNLLHFFAYGADGVSGTADDDRIAMRTSRYDPLQGISGVENTEHRTEVALR